MARSCPASHVAGVCASADRLSPRARRVRSSSGIVERLVDRVGRLRQVEGVDREGVAAEAAERAGVAGQDQHAAARVHHGSLHRHEVHAVVDGVHEHRVVLVVRGDRVGEVLLHLEHDRGPVLLPERRVDPVGGRAAVGPVVAIGGHLLT